MKLTLTLPLLIVALSGHQEPCGCRGYDNAVAANQGGRLVLYATVTSLELSPDSVARAAPGRADRAVGVTVERWWPGRPSREPLEISRHMTIYTMAQGCGYPFEIGRAYLIAVQKWRGGIPTTRQCSGTQPADPSATAFAELGKGLEPGGFELTPPAGPPRLRPGPSRVPYELGILVAAYAVFAGVVAARRRRARGGSTRPSLLVGFVMLAALSGAAVIVEGATRGLARAEAQRAADFAALGAVGFLLQAPGDTVGAIKEARRIAEANPVRGRPPVVLPGDVTLIPDSARIRVRVRARAYGIPRVLAWLIGVEEVRVSAEATAEGGAASTDPRDLPIFRVLRLVE